ncbi:MAG TPA: hypothetical protein VKA16_01235 [Burkholderiales bacterium]|nr:hypothetical protein [Burkholderiales bacterium]
MDSIVELEKRIVRNPKKAAPEELDTLARHYWDLATRADDFRDKRSHLKRSSFFAGLAFAAGLDSAEQLGLYRAIVQRAAEVHTFPADERRKLSKIIAKWLEKTGGDKHKVLGKAKGIVTVGGGTISLGDRARFATSGEDATFDQQMVQWTNRGERLSFATGGDGVYKAELRLIDATEPVLTAAEYKKLRSSTPTVVIDVPTGALGMAEFAQFLDEPWDKQEVEGTVRLDVPPGRYKACAFGFATASSESVIAVVTATSDEPRNETGSVDSLFG